MAKASLIQVEELIKSGRLEEAEALLDKTVKLYDLKPMQRVTASIHFHWLGKTVEAVRILGPILNASEVSSASDENIYLQIRRGQLLAFSGASFVAETIFRDVEFVVSKRERDFTRDFPQYHRSLADYAINRGDYGRAYGHFAKVVESFDSKDQAAHFAKIGLCDCLDGLGRSSEAIDIITNFISELTVQDRIFKAIALQARGEYYFRSEQWEKARADFDQAFAEFGDANETKDFAYLLKWSGALSIYEGDLVRAENELMQAYTILNQPKSQPHALMEVLYWLEKLKSGFLSLENRIALRAHPCRSHFSLLMGSTHAPATGSLPRWIESQIPKSSSAVWKIEKDISAGSYEKFAKEVELVPVLDLFSGMIRLPDNSFELLTAIEASFLTAVVGASAVGVNDWTLVDIVYQQQFSDYESGFDRLKALTTQLKKKGLRIERDKNRWRWNQEDWVVLLPSDLCCLGPQAWLSAQQHVFSRVDVEKIFTVPSRTANNWIQNWQTKGFIKALKSGKNIQYHFAK